MKIIITESQYKRITEQNERVSATYDVLSWKYGYESDEHDEWSILIDFLLTISVENKTYEYTFTVGGNVTEDDEWEIEEDRIDWDVIGNEHYLKTINGREINMKLDGDKINEVIFATDYSAIEDKISEIYREAY